MHGLTPHNASEAREVFAATCERHGFHQQAEVIRAKEEDDGDGTACILDAMLAFAETPAPPSTASSEGVREAVEVAYREGHSDGRTGGSLMDEDDDWLESDSLAALTHPHPSGGVEGDWHSVIAAAYTQGATDVHRFVSEGGEIPRGDADFKEAASDYAKAALDPFSSAARGPTPTDPSGEVERVAQIIAKWPKAEGERRDALSEAASHLARYSADAPGTPTRDCLVFLNAAINPHARRIIAEMASPQDVQASEPGDAA